MDNGSMVEDPAYYHCPFYRHPNFNQPNTNISVLGENLAAESKYELLCGKINEHLKKKPNEVFEDSDGKRYLKRPPKSKANKVTYHQCHCK